MINKKCMICNNILGKRNKSGYCTFCYVKSPFMLEYQKLFQRKWYAKKINKDKKKAYRKIPKVKAHYKKYQKKYQKDHIDRMRIQKREWARNNRR